MVFPEEAVYGTLIDTSHVLSPPQRRDNRDDTNSDSAAPQTPTSHDGSSTSSSSYQDLVHIASRDEEGNPCAEIEVTRTIQSKKSSTALSMVDQHLHLMRSTSLFDEEELSPHIDTNTTKNDVLPPVVVSIVNDAAPPQQQPSPIKKSALPPQLPLSPSANSTGSTSIDFSTSNLDQKLLEQDTDSFKQYLLKLKSDRDRYKNERNALQSQVDGANSLKDKEITRLQTELDTLKEKADEEITILLEDLHTSKMQLQEMTKTVSLDQGEEQELRKQLQLTKERLLEVETALDTEKSSSSLREATRVEEARHAQFEQFKLQIQELESQNKEHLAEVRVQKDKEVQSLQEELGTARGIQEHLASQVEEGREELDKVRGAFDVLSKEHEVCGPTVLAMEEALKMAKEEMKEAMERVKSEKEGLAGQLEAKHMELVQVKGEFANEHDRMKEQLTNLTNLVESKTTDLAKSHEIMTSLQKELCASKMETTKAMESIATLSEENYKLKQEVEAMDKVRLEYEQRDQERLVEVVRLHAKLEEIHSLVPSPSQDSSKDGNNNNNTAAAAATAAVGKSSEGACATVPDLDDGTDSTSTSSTVNELEATRNKLKMVEVERDIIKTQLEDMKKFPPFTKSLTTGKKADPIIADLEEKLEKAEQLYVDVAVENSELKAKLGSPKNGQSVSLSNDDMASKLKSIKAELLIKDAEIATLKRKVSLKDNEQAHAHTTDEEGTKLKDEVIMEIANLLETKQQQQLVTDANATSEIAADVPAGIILGNDLDDIKHEHRVEVKLLMEKHASLKTQIQLLTKQKEQIASAYEVEQTCSAELESSLQEMVALLEAERSMHSGKLKELKAMKHKFSKLKKKRVPVDAAYRASLRLLEQLELKKSASQNSGEVEKVMDAAIDLINSLTRAVEKEDSSETSPVISKDSLPDDKQTKALSEACEKLELSVMSMKMQLSTKTTEFNELQKAKTDDDVMHQEAVQILKQQLAEFSESAATFEETVATYKSRLGEAEEKNASLHEQLSELKDGSLPKPDEEQRASAITHEVEHQESDFLKQQLHDVTTKHQALEAEKIELLGTIQEMRDAHQLTKSAKKSDEEKHDQLQDLVQKYETIQVENKKLIEEVASTKKNLEEVLAEFDQTLRVTCDAHEKALSEKQEECQRLIDELDKVTKELSNYKDTSLQEITGLTDEVSSATDPQKELESSKEVALLGKARKELSIARSSNDKEGMHASKLELDQHLSNLEENLRAEAIKQEMTQNENESLKQQIQDVETKCQSLEEEKTKLVGEVSKAKDSFEQVIAEFEEELKATCEASEQALREKQEECKELIEQLDKLKEELSDSKETSLQEITRLTDMASTDKASFEELQRKLEVSKEEMQHKEKLLEDLREELADSEESERALQEIIALHEASIEALKKELDTANTKMADLEDTKRSLKESVEVCMQQRSELQLLGKAKLALESDAANHDQAISMMEHELKTTRSEITLKNRQIQLAQEETEKTKRGWDMSIQSMEEVNRSLQEQIKAAEAENETNRSMYEKDIQLQQQEVEALQKKHSSAMSDLDSLSELISTLKESLASEKESSKILLAQFNKSEEDRKSQTKQKAELEEELAATMQSVDELKEQLSCLEADLAVAMTEEEEQELRERLSSQEQELTDLRAKVDSIEANRKDLQDEFKSNIHKKDEESTKLRIILQEAKDKLSRLHKENEKLRNENSDAVNSMSEMLNEAVRGRAEVEMSLQENMHLLEKQKRMDIKKNSQISKMEHELQILQTKERYQETLIASLKNQIKRGM